MSTRENMGALQRDMTPCVVHVESLVLMKISRHCSSGFSSVATGFIVGMQQNETLEVTNSFPFPTADGPTDAYQNEAAALASSGPRTKSNMAYQNEMIRQLREVSVDANSVGWYTGANMGNFITANFIENQFAVQKESRQVVALVFDSGRSSHGALNVRAFQLAPQFMATYAEGKISTESLRQSRLSFKKMLVEIPVVFHNSHLITSFLHGLCPMSTSDLPMPVTVEDVESAAPSVPPGASVDSLELSIDPFLEKTADLLLESIESHYTEFNNYQYYQRQLSREQTKISTWQAKRKAENAQRVAAKQAPLPEDEWQRLYKLPSEPSRLEGMINARQVDQYGRQLDAFAASTTVKMFAVRGTLLYE